MCEQDCCPYCSTSEQYNEMCNYHDSLMWFDMTLNNYLLADLPGCNSEEHVVMVLRTVLTAYREVFN